MFVWPWIIDINNVEDQPDATIKFYWYSNQLNTFWTIFCPSSEAQDCVLLLVVQCTQVVAGRWPGMRRHWLCVRCEGSNILHKKHIASASAFQATGRQQLGCIIPQAVKHSLALLRMGKKLSETYWADWNNNKILLFHLVGLLHYLHFIVFVGDVFEKFLLPLLQCPCRTSALQRQTIPSPTQGSFSPLICIHFSREIQSCLDICFTVGLVLD